jgi:hypothetical protein
MKIISSDMYNVEMERISIGGLKIADYVTTLLDTGNSLICIPMRFKQ